MASYRQPRMPRMALLLAVVLGLCGTAAQAAEADRIYLRFEVSGGPGLHVLTVRVTVDQSTESYAIAVIAETRGVADVFADLRSRLEVRGKISAGALSPELMQAETHRRGADLATRIDYGADGAVRAVATPPPNNPVTPVTSAQMRGTVDQMTAYLALARHLGRKSSCALALSVFDGRRRYDLSFSDLASETRSEFSTPLQVCGMARQRIAGFPVAQPGKEASDRGKLYFGRLLPGDLAVPVRLEFDSEFGIFTAHLAELRGRGIDLRFTE